MPPSKSRGETYLSTEETIKSRTSTLCGLVVEAINGQFKCDFKIFRYKVFRSPFPSTTINYKVDAALKKSFQEPYGDIEYSKHFIEIMNGNNNKSNLLANYVQENNFNRQGVAFVFMQGKSKKKT